MIKSLRDFLTMSISLVVYVLMLPSRFFRKIIILDEETLKINSPIIFISNHRSVLDPWIISSSLPFTFFLKHLPVKILASSSRFGKHKSIYLLKNFKILDFIYFLYQCVEIKDASSPEEKLENFQKEINKGYSVLFFPEGGISNENKIGEIKQGVAILRKNNPGKPFVFLAVNYKKTWIPFYKKSYFVLGKADFDQHDNYQEFVSQTLINLSNKI
jgi:1-acyl-sn-glycerol-3-phosphate acyltransferase